MLSAAKDPCGLIQKRQSRTKVGDSHHFCGGIGKFWSPASLPLLTPYSARPCGGPVPWLGLRRHFCRKGNSCGWQRTRPLPILSHHQAVAPPVPCTSVCPSLAPGPAVSEWKSRIQKSRQRASKPLASKASSSKRPKWRGPAGWFPLYMETEVPRGLK